MIISNAVFKTIGFVKLDNKFIDSCHKYFNKVKTSEELSLFLESTYHSEYIDIMYSKDNFHFEKIIKNELTISNKNTESVILNKFELFLFKNNDNTYTGIYSLDYLIDENDISIFSDISCSLINHNTQIQYESKKSSLIEFISKQFFLGKKLNDMNDDLSQFSGNKFKHYTILDFNNPISKPDELLFELGTNSKVGSISNNDLSSPSKSYFNFILKNKLSCFKNYSGLSLYDSFTIIGSKNFDRNEFYSNSSWNIIYFKIFIFNQFLKSRLQIISNSFSIDPLKSRNYFENFFSKYYLNKISFNFLPNEIYRIIFNSLEIENDINFLRKRTDTYSIKVNEIQQKQQEFLLLCLSILAAIEIPLHIDNLREIIGIDNYSIYSSIIYPLILTSLIVIFILKFISLIKQKKDFKY